MGNIFGVPDVTVRIPLRYNWSTGSYYNPYTGEPVSLADAMAYLNYISKPPDAKTWETVLNKINFSGVPLPPITVVAKGRGGWLIKGGIPTWWGDHPLRWPPQGQGGWASQVDWGGASNAFLNILGGVGEMVVGGVGTYFSAGAALL